MKTNFFGLSFLLLFLRMQIYEAIAAIFWQSSSYVSFYLSHDFVLRVMTLVLSLLVFCLEAELSLVLVSN